MDVGVFEVEVVGLDESEFADHLVEQHLTDALHLLTRTRIRHINCNAHRVRVDNAVADLAPCRNESDTSYAAVTG